MIYEDRVYGKVQIGEPVILEIIDSPEMQRLKGVDQAGYYDVYFPGTKQNRFLHSMGVYLLLKKYGADMNEQIAGLIHDVSHSAFSHAIDYILEEGSQKEHSHQDNAFADYVRKSSIKNILAKYNIDVEYIIDDKNFPLKENNIPDICADRIDYSLRDGLRFDMASKENVDYFLEHLSAENGKWIFDDFPSAEKFAHYFDKLNRFHWSSYKTGAMYRSLGDYLKHALAKGYINKDDLYTTDDQVLGKIVEHFKEDPELQRLFARLNTITKSTNDPKNFEAQVFVKSRIIDPLCRHNGEIKRVSDIDPKWKKVVERELEPKEYFVRFLD